jgi:hypothetical protein
MKGSTGQLLNHTSYQALGLFSGCMKQKRYTGFNFQFDKTLRRFGFQAGKPKPGIWLFTH